MEFQRKIAARTKIVKISKFRELWNGNVSLTIVPNSVLRTNLKTGLSVAKIVKGKTLCTI